MATALDPAASNPSNSETDTSSVTSEDYEGDFESVVRLDWDHLLKCLNSHLARSTNESSRDEEAAAIRIILAQKGTELITEEGAREVYQYYKQQIHDGKATSGKSWGSRIQRYTPSRNLQESLVRRYETDTEDEAEMEGISIANKMDAYKAQARAQRRTHKSRRNTRICSPLREPEPRVDYILQQDPPVDLDVIELELQPYIVTALLVTIFVYGMELTPQSRSGTQLPFGNQSWRLE